MNAKTSVKKPWALVLWGGAAHAGKHAPTRLAFLKEAVKVNGKIIGYKAHTFSEASKSWTKNARKFDEGDVLKMFKVKQTPAELRAWKALFKERQKIELRRAEGEQ
jgi:hypothetical protein